MPRSRRAPTVRKTNPCSGTGCTNEVPERRPSETGTHWCSSSACQAERQRYYRSRNKGGAAQTTMELAAELVEAMTHDRMRCGICGYESGIPGFMHPDPRPEFGAPCKALGPKGSGISELLAVAYGMMTATRKDHV